MPDVRCLNCGAELHLEEYTYANYYGQLTCEYCKGIQFITTQNGNLVAAQTQPTYLEAIHDILAWRIPEERLADVAEAAHVLYQGAYKSSVVMSRRCIQGVLLYLNITDQPLGRMIDDLVVNHPQHSDLASQLKAVKLFGDAGAHPNDRALNEVTQLNATLCVYLVKEVLKAVFPRRQT